MFVFAALLLGSNTSVSRNFTLIPKKAASWNYVGHRAKVAYTFQNTDSEMIHQVSSHWSCSMDIIAALSETETETEEEEASNCN